MLNARMSEILHQLVGSAGFVTISDLSRHLKVSPRTVRYDLDKLDEWLQDKGFPLPVRYSGRGIQLTLKDEQKDQLLTALDESSSYTYVMSPDERREQIFAALFRRPERITLTSLAEELSVSKPTLISDLKFMRQKSREQGVHIVSDHRGIRVSGTETAVRKAFFRYVISRLGEPQLFELLYGSGVRNWQCNMQSLFPRDDVKIVEEVLRDSIPGGWTPKQTGGLVLLAHLTFVIQRIRQGMTVFDQSKAPDDWLEAAKLVVGRLSASLGLNPGPGEPGYAATCLQAGIAGDRLYVRDYVRSLIAAFASHTDPWIREDHILAEGLYNHLLNSGIQAGNLTENPLLAEIQVNHCEVFGFISQWCRENSFAGTVPDPGEVGYITLHLAAALERLAGHPARRSALVVCSNGVGTARMLAVKLQNNFPALRLVEVASYSGFRERTDFTDINLIISTLPLPNATKPVVVVSPFLPQEDISKLARFLGESTPGWRDQDRMVSEIMTIVAKHSSKVDDILLRAELSHYFKRSQGDMQSGLFRLLRPDRIQILSEAEDWSQAIRYASEPLLAQKLIVPRYVEAMINQLTCLGPHVVITPGVALPHAAWDQGVKRAAISLAVFKKPVRFGHRTNDPVSLVFVLAPGKNNEHLPALEQLFELMADQDNVRSLSQATTPEAVWQTITSLKVDK